MISGLQSAQAPVGQFQERARQVLTEGRVLAFNSPLKTGSMHQGVKIGPSKGLIYRERIDIDQFERCLLNLANQHYSQLRSVGIEAQAAEALARMAAITSHFSVSQLIPLRPRVIECDLQVLDGAPQISRQWHIDSPNSDSTKHLVVTSTLIAERYGSVEVAIQDNIHSTRFIRDDSSTRAQIHRVANESQSCKERFLRINEVIEKLVDQGRVVVETAPPNALLVYTGGLQHGLIHASPIAPIPQALKRVVLSIDLYF